VSETEALVGLCLEVGLAPHQVRALPRRDRLELIYGQIKRQWRERKGFELSQNKREEDRASQGTPQDPASMRALGRRAFGKKR